MKDRDPKALILDKQMLNADDSSKSEEGRLATIQLPADFPISDFLCREEHKDLFEALWRKESKK
jgi:hypothetical protein